MLVNDVNKCCGFIFNRSIIPHTIHLPSTTQLHVDRPARDQEKFVNRKAKYPIRINCVIASSFGSREAAVLLMHEHCAFLKKDVFLCHVFLANVHGKGKFSLFSLGDFNRTVFSCRPLLEISNSHLWSGLFQLTFCIFPKPQIRII